MTVTLANGLPAYTRQTQRTRQSQIDANREWKAREVQELRVLPLKVSEPSWLGRWFGLG